MSTCLTQFITTDEVKACTFISSNVHDATFEQNIEYAQISALRPILSTSLFDEIDTQIDTDTLTALNLTLLDTWIKPFLAWKIYQLSLTGLYVRITPSGIQTKSTGDLQSIDASTLRMLKNEAEGRADHFQTLLVDYIVDNQIDYPEYTTTASHESRTSRPSMGGFVFSGSSSNHRQICSCRNWPLCPHAND